LALKVQAVLQNLCDFGWAQNGVAVKNAM